MRTHCRVSTFRTHETRTGPGALYTPGTAVSTDRKASAAIACRLSAAVPAIPEKPPAREVSVTRHQQGFPGSRPIPVLPLACGRHGWNGGPWAFRELRTQTGQEPATHVTAGTGQTQPVATFPASARPPQRAHSPRATSCRKAFHYCFVPEGQLLTKARLIRAAGLRWPVEEDFAFSKDCFGLDQCQARLYAAIARHTVLVMAALAICAITTALLRDRTDTQAPPPVRPGQWPPPEPGMIPLTIPEIKRVLAALTTRPLPRWLVIHWDAWTRRHQARARWFHKRARLARDAEITLLS